MIRTRTGAEVETSMQSNETSSAALLAIEIGLPSADIASMRRFYCEGLGFRHFGTVDLPSAHIEGYRAGACLLKFTVFSDEALRPLPRQPSLQSPYVTVRVADIVAIVARCEAQGFKPLHPISTATTATGRQARFAFFADPMGNRVEIVEGDAWQPQS